MEATLPKQQQLAESLFEALTGGALPEYVAAKRAERRPQWSWRLISEQLAEDTDGKVSLSHETLRLWYSDAERAEAAAS